MSASRIFAIVIIYLIAVGGWLILGTATSLRSEQSTQKSGNEVEQLWGKSLLQRAPKFFTGSVDAPNTLAPLATRVRTSLSLNYRRRGLVWHPTYLCEFAGDWRIRNPDSDSTKDIRFHFDFPDNKGTYENFILSAGNRDVTAPIQDQNGIDASISLGAGEEATLHIAYKTRGVGEWRFDPGNNSGRISDLETVISTDFKDIDYPVDGLPPTSATSGSNGMILTWKMGDLITRKQIGLIVPERLNPGPLAARIIFFAPVCLIFFFVLVAAIHIVRNLPIHPMHYLFIAAGFFAFHILLAYLVDVVEIHLAFLIGAASSVTLVTGYLRAALGKRFPSVAALAAQLFFLILFSYSFFFKGMTGLTVAVGSVVTLAVLMWLTAHTDWALVFSKPNKAERV